MSDRSVIYVGDCSESLKSIASDSIHCCVTSPPYFGLRDYGVGGQVGMESSPEHYISRLVGIFSEVRRVLRKDGTLWLNLGDSYNNFRGSQCGQSVHGKKQMGKPSGRRAVDCRLKEKDLIGIPWRVALALQRDGWWLRQDVVWSKPNPMPESVADRCTKSHEYVFLLAKSKDYFFDSYAIREDAADGIESRNRRSVWAIPTKPFRGAHFATMPIELAAMCVSAGASGGGCCTECGSPAIRCFDEDRVVTGHGGRHHHSNRDSGRRDVGVGVMYATRRNHVGWSFSCNCAAGAGVCTVLDPFGGSGTTGMVAKKMGHRFVMCELNSEYAEMARSRCGGGGVFDDVEVVVADGGSL